RVRSVLMESSASGRSVTEFPPGGEGHYPMGTAPRQGRSRREPCSMTAHTTRDRMRAMRAPACLAVLALGAAACGDDDTSGSDWHVVQEELPGALLSVWGGAPDDVWAVGGDPDQTLADNGPAPPQVLHWDGAAWETLDPGTQGSLWWVFGRPGGAIYMGGENATIVKYEGGAFSVMDTPGTTETVFGIWGCSEDPSQVWAVGGNYGGSDGAFAWRLDGDAWVAADGFPSDELAGSALWKVHGRACDDAY